MIHDHRVMVHIALSGKRAQYIENWVEALENSAGHRRSESLTYWAARIERCNDAAASFDRLMWAEGRAI